MKVVAQPMIFVGESGIVTRKAPEEAPCVSTETAG
jgi:hypothetical protein